MRSMKEGKELEWRNGGGKEITDRELNDSKGEKKKRGNRKNEEGEGIAWTWIRERMEVNEEVRKAWRRE